MIIGKPNFSKSVPSRDGKHPCQQSTGHLSLTQLAFSDSRSLWHLEIEIAIPADYSFTQRKPEFIKELSMNVKSLAILIAIVLVNSTGCKTIRNVEQWKCDHWGLCHFGIKPSSIDKSSIQSGQPNSADCGCNTSTSELPQSEMQAPKTWRQ